MAYDPKKNQGQGTENIDSSVLGLPFLSIIQKGSPEFDETHRNYATKKIEGCRPGNILFALKRKVLAQPLLVIPVATTTLYVEWKSRDNGGGFVGNRPLTITNDPNYRRGAPGSPAENKEYLGQNELIYTIYFMFLFQLGSEWEKGVISFTGTQLKHARAWLRSIKSLEYPEFPDVKPPIFAATYRLTTKAETNTRGGWFGWDVARDRVLDLTKDEALLTTAEAASVQAVQNLPTLTTAPTQARIGNTAPSTEQDIF